MPPLKSFDYRGCGCVIEAFIVGVSEGANVMVVSVYGEDGRLYIALSR